jgi:hypothetical protein
MKRYSVLSVLWLIACGAGAGASDGEDSSLSSPLSDGDDDAAQLASGDEENDATVPDDVWNGAGESDEASAVDGASAPTASAGVVIGGGGRAWPGPADGGVVVWCHADVPIGCAAIAPTPEAGRLVVVKRTSEMGAAGGGAIEVVHDEAIEGSAGSADSVPVGAEAPDSVPGDAWSEAADPVPVAGGEPASSAAGGGVIYVDAMPVPGVPPAPPLPVLIGGSLPPVSGTCVAITFGAGGGGHVIGTASDGPDGGARVVRQQQADDAEPGFPGAPSAGGGASDPAPSAGAASGTAPSAGAAPTASGAPSAGASVPAAPPPTGIPAPPPPALPPPGVCLGVSYAPGTGISGVPGSPAAPVPSMPGTPHDPGAPVPGYPPAPMTGVVSVPAPPGKCVNVAFASGSDSSSPEAMPAPPVMCALPVPPPPVAVPTEPARPEDAEDSDVRADEVR